MALKTLANSSKLFIKLSGDSAETEVKNVSEITLPNQSFASVETPLLDQSTGISERVKSTNRAGGELTFKLTARDAADAGLLKVAEAYEDTDEVAVADQPEFTVQIGTIEGVMHGNVTEMSRGALTKDGLLTYDVKVEVNDVVAYGTVA